ncbi:hypothetical protein MCOR02_009866 [Pyricularia oryzae]|uniref:DUF7719 domain-containing protein n=1 Tax=Pyricularia oryzae TaxID=318829 RepID=A0A4V1C6B9_PYROR|nr:hypothetical protein MCOR02_009866 [Pyricularia oryzae]KAI6402253.1 hypothetical protein MCOR20_007737 [Pyricularia oryzae]KAI6486373.1 hypothetical protein MCOR11_009324 [Pyricularia oryzae]KAI6501044.1 hypothetical protein MCOR13_005792 [Pyricularia oryzae]KAI6613914.1 hypothetical protein MCOR08_010123 [Pyricularia oryzae]
MARKRKADPVKIELKQPDRSGPSDKTLLDIASERNLFRQADEKQRENDLKKHGWSAVAAADTTEEGEAESLSPQAERILDTLLWGVSLAMLHFTFDVLVQNQFAMEITWPKVFTRAFQALLVFGFLFYNLHPHVSNPILVPFVPRQYQNGIRQAVFFAASTAAGCYLIHVTNEHAYLAVMKTAPSIGCVWVWAVLELNLSLSLLSLAITYVFFKLGGYSLA